MTATVVYIEHAMAPSLASRHGDVPAGISAAAALTAAGIDVARDTVLLRRDPADDPRHLSDLFVPFKDWDKEVLNDGDRAVFLRYSGLPQGPAGSSAIMAVLAKLSAFAGPSLAASLGVGGFSAFGITAGSLISSALYIGGSMLISSLLPKPKQSADTGTTSPTYSLSAQSNTVRLGQPVPDQVGLCMGMLDVAMQPYTQYIDGKQVVRQLFLLGEGRYDIDQIRADEAVIWRDGAVTDAYPEVQVEVLSPGDMLTLFEDNVVTSSEVVNGITLSGTNEKDHKASGPYIGSKRGQGAMIAEFDVAISCYKLSGTTLEAATVSYKFTGQRIDNDGNTIGSVVTLVEDTQTLSSRDVVRKTLRVPLDPPGRWQFWAERTNNKSNDLAVSDVVQWTGLRVFLPSRLVYPNTTMIAISATATSNLNGDALQKINAISTRMLPVYDSETQSWSAPQATRSIAAGVCYLLKDIGGKTDAQIDLATLWSLDETWTSRGDYFDYRFDQRQSLWENSLEPMLRAGRSRPIPIGDSITFVRDEPKTLYDGGAFTPANMYPSNFEVEFRHDVTQTTDAIAVTFLDRRTWRENRVLCALPGSTLTKETAPQVTFAGYIDRDHTWRDGMFLVADGYYRRIRPSFKSNREGTYLLPGAKARLSHYLMGWGKSAAVDDLAHGVTQTTGDGPLYKDILTLSQPWSRPDDETGPNLIEIVTPDRKVYGPVTFDLIDSGSETFRAAILLTSKAAVEGKFAGKQPRDWGLWDGSGLQLKRPRCVLSVGSVVSRDVRVVTMKPEAGGRAATVGCFLEDARVYAVDTGTPPAEDGGPSGSTAIDLVIDTLTLTESVITTHALFGLHGVITGADDAVSFEARWQLKSAVAKTGGGYNYVWGAPSSVVGNLARTFDLSIAITETIPNTAGVWGKPVRLYVRARNAAGDYGPWFTKTLFLDGTADTAPGNCTDFAQSRTWISSPTDPVTFSCTPPATATYFRIKIKSRRNNDEGWTDRGERIIDDATFTYYYADQINDGGPFLHAYIQWKAGNAAGESPDWQPTLPPGGA